MIVKFVFVQVHMNDETFLVLRVTFLENFCFLFSTISCVSELRSELHQNRYCSLVNVLVNVCCFCLVGKVFYQYFLCFAEMLLGYEIFRHHIVIRWILVTYTFPVFFWKLVLYSTRIFEYCIL